ncbi:MAG TPA: tetratricopeptide repeat protein, partial [Gemmataceae bacterium]
MAHNNLGLILSDMGRRDEAIEEYHKAIESDPNLAMAHYNLGNSLRDKEPFDKAVGEYEEAIRLKNDYAEAHCNLGHMLQRKGRFAEALEYFHRGHELGSQQTSWRYPSAQWLRQCERLMELDHKLPAILRGEAEPADVSERQTLADLCGRYKRLPAASARLYADAFTTEPILATGLNQQYRYNAACSAALAAAGQGEDARLLPDKVVTMFRRWALGWLREELAAYGKIAPQSNSAMKQTIQQRLAHWQRDPDLASVRESEQLAKLPQAEQEEWRRLWAGVAGTAALSDRAGRLADNIKAPSPVTMLRSTAVKRNVDQAIRAAALHLPYAYVLDRTGDLWVFKLPDEAGEKPGQELQEVEHLSAAGDGNALVVIGGTLLCSRAGSVEAFSLEDPARPRHLGKFGPEKRYWTQALVISHDRLILVGPGGLSVFAVSNPARPQHLGTTQPQRFSWNGCVVGGRLYVAEVCIPSFKNSRNGIAIYDLADPKALKEVGFVATPASPYHLLPVGKDRLAVLMDDKAQLYSTADPLKPAALGQPVAASARSGAVCPIDGHVYLVTSSDVFRIEEKDLVRIGGFRAGGTYDGQPYHGSSQGGYAIVPLTEAAVVLRPEAGSASRLLPPGRPEPGVLAAPPVQVGQELDLAGPTVQGDKFDLKQLRGKVVLIDFWATWCGPCVAEMPNVKRVYDRYHKDGFEVVGV